MRVVEYFRKTNVWGLTVKYNDKACKLNADLLKKYMISQKHDSLYNYWDKKYPWLKTHNTRTKSAYNQKVITEGTIDDLFRQGKALVKMVLPPINSNDEQISWDFICNQLADPANRRPIKTLETYVDRSKRWNPRTKKEVKRIFPANSRGAAKPDGWPFTKKTATTLLPKNGRMHLCDSHKKHVGILFDMDYCYLKDEDFVWEQNAYTRYHFWLGNSVYNGLKNGISLPQLQQAINQHADGEYVAHNEILACLSLQALRGIVITEETDMPLAKEKCANLFQTFGILVPIVLIDGRNQYKIIHNPLGIEAGQELIDSLKNGKFVDALDIISKSRIEKTPIDLSLIDPDTGDTALHYAMRNKDMPLIEALYASGAQLDIPNKNQETPLDILLAGNDYEFRQTIITILLLMIQQKLDLTNNWKCLGNLLLVYIKNGEFDPRISKQFIATNVNKKVQHEETGNTAMHFAVMHRTFDLIQALALQGASLHTPNKADKTSSDIAIANYSDEEFANFLSAVAPALRVIDTEEACNLLSRCEKQNPSRVVQLLPLLNTKVILSLHEHIPDDTKLYNSVRTFQGQLLDQARQCDQASVDIRKIKSSQYNFKLQLYSNRSNLPSKTHPLIIDITGNISEACIFFAKIHKFRLIRQLTFRISLDEIDINHQDSETGKTTLHYAALAEQYDIIVDIYMRTAARLDIKDKNGVTVFDLLCRNKKFDLIKKLFAAGLNNRFPQHLWGLALYYFTCNKRFDLAKALLDSVRPNTHIDFNVADLITGNTCYHYSFISKEWDVLGMILNHPINIALRNCDGKSIVDLFLEYHDPSLLPKELCSKLLFCCMQYSDFDSAERILDSSLPLDVNITTSITKETALYIATVKGQHTLARKLLRHGATQENDPKPWKAALQRKRYDMLQIMVEESPCAEVQVLLKANLLLACLRDQAFTCADSLLKSFGTISSEILEARDETTGSTALHYAIAHQQIDIALQLCNFGAIGNSQSLGFSAVVLAAAKKQYVVVEKILDNMIATHQTMSNGQFISLLRSCFHDDKFHLIATRLLKHIAILLPECDAALSAYTDADTNNSFLEIAITEEQEDIALVLCNLMPSYLRNRMHSSIIIKAVQHGLHKLAEGLLTIEHFRRFTFDEQTKLLLSCFAANQLKIGKRVLDLLSSLGLNKQVLLFVTQNNQKVAVNLLLTQENVQLLSLEERTSLLFNYLEKHQATFAMRLLEMRLPMVDTTDASKRCVVASQAYGALKDDKGRTAILYAATVGNEMFEVVSSLLTQECINNLSPLECSALLLCCMQNKKFELAKRILSFAKIGKIDFSMLDNNGKTVFHLAIEADQDELALDFIAKGASGYLRDQNKEPAILTASHRGKFQIVEKLLENLPCLGEVSTKAFKVLADLNCLDGLTMSEFKQLEQACGTSITTRLGFFANRNSDQKMLESQRKPSGIPTQTIFFD
jgi:ankyrin repeat protein